MYIWEYLDICTVFDGNPLRQTRAAGWISDQLPLVWHKCAPTLLICHILSLNAEAKNKLTKWDCYCDDLNCCSSGPRTPDFAIFYSFPFPAITALLDNSHFRLGIILPHFVCDSAFFIIFYSYCYLFNMLLSIPQNLIEYAS